MNSKLLSQIDTMITKVGLVNRSIDGLARLLLPKSIAEAGCGGVQWCYEVATSVNCYFGCDETCHQKLGTVYDVYYADNIFCIQPCVWQNRCGSPFSQGAVCGPC